MNSELVFVAGASRGVGREIVHLLCQQGIPVKTILRSEVARPELEALGVQVVIADALDYPAVLQAFQDNPPATVISTIGGVSPDGQRSDYLGNKHLIDAAVAVGVSRFVLVSSIGTGNSAIALPPHILQALGPALVEKDQAEQHLIASGLNYTIIRPGGLKSEPATHQGVLTEDVRVAGSIHRADVAPLVIQSLESDRTHRRTFSAVDRNQCYGEANFEVFAL